MKKLGLMALIIMTGLIVTACSKKGEVDKGYEGTYTGYSWKDEAKGVAFDDATEYIETTLTLDKAGIITAASLDFKVFKGGQWVSRADQDISVSVDFSVTPTIADARFTGRQEGTSMFTINTVDFMSLYAVAVDQDGTVAFGIVEPVTRYLFEMKFDSSFDFSTQLRNITIQNGTLVPTRLTSGGSFLRPQTWETLETKDVFNMHAWAHVMNSEGVFEGLFSTHTVKALLEKAGVTFVNNVPQPKEATAGFFGLGGWKGNLDAIAASLVGQDAKTFEGIVDWSVEKYALGVNENNVFGVDVLAGGTSTIQNSMDPIAGATVRVSREATSIQRALVATGLLSADKVIIGRF